MTKRLTFPAYNAAVCGVFGALIGYYTFHLWQGTAAGALFGLAFGGLIEWGLGRLGTGHRLYQRRVLICVVLEIPIAIFVAGPYAYVLLETRPDHHTVCCETPLDYGAADYETVTIETADGVTLVGWYVPPAHSPGPVVILLHGGRGDRRGTLWHASHLIEAGYGVLLYDQRALGESGGDAVTLGWLDGPDLLAVADFLDTRPEVDPDRLGVVGVSLGGQIALNAAALAPDRFAALWLDGVWAQRIDDFPEAQNTGEQFATLINGLILKMAEIHLRRTAPPAFIDTLPALTQPRMVLVAGVLDDFEYRVNRRYAEVIGSNAEVWFIDTAGHVGGPAVIPDEYSRRMIEFFDATLQSDS